MDLVRVDLSVLGLYAAPADKSALMRHKRFMPMKYSIKEVMSLLLSMPRWLTIIGSVLGSHGNFRRSLFCIIIVLEVVRATGLPMILLVLSSSCASLLMFWRLAYIARHKILRC